MSLWTAPRTWANGELVTTAMLNEVSEELEFLHDRMQGGTVTVTPSAANTATALAVNFLTEFSDRPYVFVSYHGNNPGKTGTNRVYGVAAREETPTGFEVNVTSTGTAAVQVNWLAILL